ncbi:MAG: GGDEF domain-containing protein [Gammaproteobacteria bacterium]|nr:GGDEF domain-containing protein [Gammaproteobacteria bacterium]
MIENNLEVYSISLFILMIVEVLSIIIILLRLRNTELPLGMIKIYTVYFIVGLLGWVVGGLSNAYEQYINLTWGSFSYVACGYLLLIAVSKNRCHPAIKKALLALTIILLIFCLLQTSTVNQLLILSIYGTVIYIPIGYFSFKNTIKERNWGDGMITFAVFAHVMLSIIQIYLITLTDNPSLAHSLGLINSSSGYLLVGIGFIASILFREHQILVSQSITDPLTKLLNRRGMEYSLNLTIPKMTKQDFCLSAMAFDIDHFKKVNDTFGHDGGDEVLKNFAKIIDDNHRDIDICCRLGGEEFIILLPKINIDDALKKAEILREKIEQTKIQFNEFDISVTSSIGVSTQCADINIDELLKNSDKALYEAKNSGRNRVCGYKE